LCHWHGASACPQLLNGTIVTGLKFILSLMNPHSAPINLAPIDCLNCGIDIINLDDNKAKAARATIITIQNYERALNFAKVTKQV
jgi:hypothetical protein